VVSASRIALTAGLSSIRYGAGMADMSVSPPTLRGFAPSARKSMLTVKRLLEHTMRPPLIQGDSTWGDSDNEARFPTANK
jgi:hypothetical protein